VFLVKTPSADLLLFGILLSAGLLVLFRNKFGVNLRKIPAAWATLIVPAVLYFGFSMMSHIDLGVRHLLPFYPFFLIALAAGFFGLVRPQWPVWYGLPLTVICVLLAAESLSSGSAYLSYFNLLSGGTWRGPYYLLDSNIDWGEDLKRLKVYMDAHPAPQYCLEYFGNADQGYYGIDHAGYVPRTNQPQELQSMDCMVAISVTLLYDLYEAPGSFTWLRARKPVDRVGGIWIFDMRKPHG